MSGSGQRVAVVGAGIAGATVARLLADAGVDVTVFDKSRGVGGRLATRRALWRQADGTEHPAQHDHGAPGFSAHAPEFVRAVEQAHRDGLLARWVPRPAPGGYAPLDEPALWVPTPDMPAWCRAMLAGVDLHTGGAVDALHHGPDGWRLDSAGATIAAGFDTVVVAIPPAQAAPLLRPHQPGWAQRAQALPMRPGWTLMAVTDDVDTGADWDLAWPSAGPAACVLRNDAKPGRQAVPGRAHWVLHATADWSQTHLEAPPAEVQSALQAALQALLQRPVVWHHAVVHRWRYASAPRAAAGAGRCWWDAASGLGVCGDALGGGGVEGAWTSARALATLALERTPGVRATTGVGEGGRP